MSYQQQYETEKNDCMVLFLEEWEEPYSYSRIESDKENSLKVDTRAYVVYDSVSKTYIIYGKRRDTRGSGDSQDYTLYFYDAKDVVNYFKYALCYDNYISYSMYSFNDLIEYGESFDTNFCYDDFYIRKTSNKELFAYDGEKMKTVRKHILNILVMMKKEATARLNDEETNKNE